MAAHIGKRIAQARKTAGWTQAQLSQRTHFSVQLVSAVEQGRGPSIPGEHADRPNRIAHYWLDLARAWLLHGNRDRCIEALGRARAISPEHVRYNPSLHETIATLAAQDARRTDSLAGLARWAGVQV